MKTRLIQHPSAVGVHTVEQRYAGASAEHEPTSRMHSPDLAASGISIGIAFYEVGVGLIGGSKDHRSKPASLIGGALSFAVPGPRLWCSLASLRCHTRASEGRAVRSRQLLKSKRSRASCRYVSKPRLRFESNITQLAGGVLYRVIRRLLTP
jgi:hypothetical protein